MSNQENGKGLYRGKKNELDLQHEVGAGSDPSSENLIEREITIRHHAARLRDVTTQPLTNPEVFRPDHLLPQDGQITYSQVRQLNNFIQDYLTNTSVVKSTAWILLESQTKVLAAAIQTQDGSSVAVMSHLTDLYVRLHRAVQEADHVNTEAMAVRAVLDITRHQVEAGLVGYISIEDIQVLLPTLINLNDVLSAEIDFLKAERQEKSTKNEELDIAKKQRLVYLENKFTEVLYETKYLETIIKRLRIKELKLKFNAEGFDEDEKQEFRVLRAKYELFGGAEAERIEHPHSPNFYQTFSVRKLFEYTNQLTVGQENYLADRARILDEIKQGPNAHMFTELLRAYPLR